jgi:hypothetical protein
MTQRITAYRLLDHVNRRDEVDLTAQGYDNIVFHAGLAKRIRVSFRNDDPRGPMLVVNSDDQLTFRMNGANWLEILL